MAPLVSSGQKTRVLRGGAFSNGIGMLTSGWRSASSLVISRWEEVTVPISYKRFSANCLYYVQLSARMKEDVFPTRRACLETEGRVKVVIFHSVASNEIEKLYQSILPLWNGIKKKKKRIFPRKIIQREINDFGRFCLKSETRNDKKLFRHFSKVIILSNSVQIEKLDFTQ